LFDEIAMELTSDNDKPGWYLARIQKMFKVTSGGARINYVRLVSIAEGSRESGVQIIVKYYKAVDETRLTFQYGGCEDDGEADPMPLTAVFCTIELSLPTDQGYFELERTDLSAFDLALKRDVQPAHPERPRPVRAPRNQNSLAVAEERPKTTQHVTRGGRRATRVVL
jgi:hypothetical protein